MNYKQIREWFIQESGRFDLVTETVNWTDAGANRYITAGQRWLDRLAGTNQKSSARFIKMLAVGDYVVLFQYFRAVKEVWVTEDAIGRWRLERKDLRFMREEYSDMDAVESGKVLYYSPAILRSLPDLSQITLGDFDAYLSYIGDLMISSHYSYNGLILMPPTDVIRMVEVIGEVYSDPLINETDENQWSVSHPELLVMSAQAMLEHFNRNSEGVKDWTNSIKILLQGIDFDAAEEEAADVTELEG